MGAPRGRSGVHWTPKAGHSKGFLRPCRTRPAMQSADSRHPRRAIQSAPRRRSGDRPREGAGRSRESRRCRATGGWRLRRSRPRAAGGLVAVAGDGAAVLVLDLGAAAFQLRNGQADALQQIQRLEAGDHDGDVVALGERFVFVKAHDRADVAGREEGLDAAVGGAQNGLDGGRNEYVGHQQREVLKPWCAACQTDMALAGAVVSKPTAKNTTWRCGLSRATLRASSGE